LVVGRKLGIGVITLVVLLAPGPARADVLQDLGATFQQVAGALAASFPKVDTRVVAVDGERVEVEGPGVDALRPGLELTAYRKGAVFRHPVTNQPLGRSEEEVGTLVVETIAPPRATTRVVAASGNRTPEVGDGARITAGRLPVAVLPPEGVAAAFETADQTALLLVARFSALLEKTGRFVTTEPRRVLEAAGFGGPGSASQASPPADEVARKLGVPAVLSSRLVLEGRARYLETAWISGRSGATLVTTRTALVRAALPPRFAWEQTPEVERRVALEGAVRGVALADLDGDGRAELVIADETAVTVHRWNEGSGLAAVAGPEFRPGGTILSLDAADLTGSGRAQIVVVAERGPIGIQSLVLELADDRLRPRYDVRGRYLRVVPVGAEAWLLEQAAGETEPFAADIRRIVWHDGAFRDGPALRLPTGVGIYGLALAHLTGSAEPEVIALTSDDKLVVWTASGQRLWTSPDAFGVPAITFAYQSPFPVQGSSIRDEPIGRVQSRIVALGDRGAGPEVLVYENILPLLDQGRRFLPRLASTLVSQGRVHRLRWKDGAFVRVWQSAVTAGYIADFAHGDLDGDSLPEVIVGVVPRGAAELSLFGRGRSHLVLYELP
jgi:hypothetical protein